MEETVGSLNCRFEEYAVMRMVISYKQDKKQWQGECFFGGNNTPTAVFSLGSTPDASLASLMAALGLPERWRICKQKAA